MGLGRSRPCSGTTKQAFDEDHYPNVSLLKSRLGTFADDESTVSRSLKRDLEFQTNKAAGIAKISRKHDSRFDNDTSTSDSSAEEDIKEASAAPEPDAGITYSFDATRGPAKGSQILGLAIAKAVEKYEIKATEKLVKEEYEVVGKEKEDHHDGYTADEDDFELV